MLPSNLLVPSPIIQTNLQSGHLYGESITIINKTIGDLAGYWHDDRTFAQTDPATPLYVTESWYPVAEGTEGALLWGNTTLLPGRVGDEYFMTRGHWHKKRDRGELVICVAGRGSLVLMNEQRETRLEALSAGTTHYIPGYTAHRTVNTGTVPLVFLCAWSADCGHDYDDIRERGFSSLLLEREGKPSLVSR
jgi:glucose-6-phosphate isomerase